MEPKVGRIETDEGRVMARNEERTAEALSRDDRADAGFTLVELLVVLAIIAMIATLVGPRVLGYIGTAKADTARTQVHNLANAVELYYLDTGAYPQADKGLAALMTNDGSPGWNGPYLKNQSGLTDPWGRPYAYEVSPGGFRIVSLGRDGAPGGTGEDADISGP